MKFTPIAPDERSEIRRALLEHYDSTARDLPWRRDSDPYRVLVSEVMLQQTRVETVKGYYVRWLERFPSVETLASAEEDEVLKAWEGLGYYRRARNLRRAALQLREAHGGVVPETYAALRELPGVGEYTAGAVASIAFGVVVPAVDGNVRRVLARLFDVETPRAPWLRSMATSLVDNERPGDWNQALMELGATQCTSRAPRCEQCPLARWCASHAAGTQLERPRKIVRPTVPTARIALAVLHRDGKVLLAKRPTEGLLGGMWAFPEHRLEPPHDSEPERLRGDCDDDYAADRDSGCSSAVAARCIPNGLRMRSTSAPVALPVCRHRFTHLVAEYMPWAIAVAGEPLGADRGWFRWIDPMGPLEVALPVAQRKVLESWSRLGTGCLGATTHVRTTK